MCIEHPVEQQDSETPLLWKDEDNLKPNPLDGVGEDLFKDPEKEEEDS